MKIKSIKIHNFRSVKESILALYDYSLLVGANNAGKTNLMTALRIFYEDDIKYNKNTDFPKFDTDDEESWIEIDYLLTEDEFSNLKQEYKNPNNILRVRKYLKSDEWVKSNQSNIYGYENGKLSDNLFYGWKTKGQSKLGSAIFIPEISKADETMKLSGPSPLRDIITFVMKKVVNQSNSYTNLNKAFDEFNKKFHEEASEEGFSLNKLKDEINESLKEWEVEFNLDINPIRPEDIIKTLVSHSTIDKNLNDEIDVKNLGQGLQRHLIYTLLRLSSKYSEHREYKKKEFSPELTLILFEEPEAFLHPGQQESLDISLKSLSSVDGQQILVSTHSPFFVSKNIEDISSLIKLKREKGVTQCYQVSEKTRQTILQENNEFTQFLMEKSKDTSISEQIRKKLSGLVGNRNESMQMEEEAIRYLLWLNPERCCAFFGDAVLICEGATEKVFIDYLIKNKWSDIREKKIYVIDVMGKFNIHRYMNLFKELGVRHSVLADKDEDSDVHSLINKFIQMQKNEFTNRIDFFDKDLETFLEIPYVSTYRKPLNVMWHYFQGKIQEEKITKLKEMVEGLL